MRRTLAALLLTVACAPSGAEAGIRTVWAAGDGDKIKRDSRLDPAPNDVWRDGVVHVFGARNEIVAFQVIVDAPMARASGRSRHGCRHWCP